MRGLTTQLVLVVLLAMLVTAQKDVEQAQDASVEAPCACACEHDLVEQLLDVLRVGVEQYDHLMQRFIRLKHDPIRLIAMALPVELSFILGLISAWISARVGAYRARRKGRSKLQVLTMALKQRTTQWKVAVAEATDLAALLEMHRQQPPQQHKGQQDQQLCLATTEVAAPTNKDQQNDNLRHDTVADVNKSAGRDTDPSKVMLFSCANPPPPLG